MTVAGHDRDAFLSDAQIYRSELIAHCYRMLGSVSDAEDLVQETYLRAWRAWTAFEGRSSIRTWLYRIATNLCLTARAHRQRRVLPSGLVPGHTEPGSGFEAAAPDTRWIEPFPNQRYEAAVSDPGELAASRSSLRLAVVASWQHLPPRQRAVFLLREVLAFSAAEVAEILEMTVPAVKSALQRARATLDGLALTTDDVAEPTSRASQAVLDRYMSAFETGDMRVLADLLRADARLEVVPAGSWLSGIRACIPYLSDYVLTAAGLYRMYPTITNGQPGAVAYRRESLTQRFEPFAVVALATHGRQLTGITVFVGRQWVDRFGFPVAPPR